MLTCRTARPSDLGSVHALLLEVMAHHGVRPPVDDELRRVLLAILEGAQRAHTPGHTFLVAEDESGVVGCCALLFSLSTWSAAPVCELQDVVVTASRRESGVGRRLLEAAGEAARSRGCVRLFLSAEVANLGGHDFYRSLGLDEKTVLYFERPLT